DYLRPAAYVLMAALPLTPNGKLDRGALPPPDPNRPASATPVTPRDGLERLVVDVWREALGVGEVGVEDNFFEVGGHSIQAALVLNRLRGRPGEPMPVAAIFEAPPPARLARYIAERYPAAAAAVRAGEAVTDGGRGGAREEAESPEELLARLEQLSDA